MAIQPLQLFGRKRLAIFVFVFGRQRRPLIVLAMQTADNRLDIGALCIGICAHGISSSFIPAGESFVNTSLAYIRRAVLSSYVTKLLWFSALCIAMSMPQTHRAPASRVDRSDTPF